MFLWRRKSSSIEWCITQGCKNRRKLHSALF